MGRIFKVSSLKIIAALVILGMTAASAACTPTTPAAAQQYPPAISYVDTQIRQMGSATPGTDVNFFIRSSVDSASPMISVIYYKDVTPPVSTTQPAFSETGTYVLAPPAEQANIWQLVAPGRHTFSAQIVYADNSTSFTPPVIVQSTIDVPAYDYKGPLITDFSAQSSIPIPQYFTTPQPVPPTQVQIGISTRNIFINDDAVGKANVAGQGHLIYYIDVAPPTTPGQPAITKAGSYRITTDTFQLWVNVANGTHTFAVQIVNNDNTPLDPPVTAQITLNIPKVVQ
jgi:hypothetical protein